MYNLQVDRGMMPLEVMLAQGLLVHEESSYLHYGLCDVCVCVCLTYEVETLELHNVCNTCMRFSGKARAPLHVPSELRDPLQQQGLASVLHSEAHG